jgi:hypothetical protein
LANELQGPNLIEPKVTQRTGDAQCGGRRYEREQCQTKREAGSGESSWRTRHLLVSCGCRQVGRSAESIPCTRSIRRYRTRQIASRNIGIIQRVPGGLAGVHALACFFSPKRSSGLVPRLSRDLASVVRLEFGTTPHFETIRTRSAGE